MTYSIFEDVRRQWGDPNEALERLRRGERNTSFALAHLEEWRLQYPDTWVGVFDEKLVAVDTDPDRLLSTLESKKIPLREAFLRFIPKEKYSLVL